MPSKKDQRNQTKKKHTITSKTNLKTKKIFIGDTVRISNLCNSFPSKRYYKLEL